MKRKVVFLSSILLASFGLIGAETAWSEPVVRAKKQSGTAFKTQKSKKVRAGLAKRPTIKAISSPAAALSITALPVAALAADVPGNTAPPPPESAPASAPQPPAPAAQFGANPYAYAPSAPAAPAQSTNPYLAYYRPAAPVSPLKNIGNLIDNVQGALPSLPMAGQSILPRIKTVYPTGEKPLVVLTFKCPTELIGVTPLPTKALHELVNLGFDGINRTDLLAFNLQQVCQ